ncbi:glycosyltransferase family protein [Cohnella xylanilytica]|uniref:glycosyltransferase family protein n=1 Tax=Cohnella xylanilytica TaxID=557555 RepID=UPI001C869864|nr:glycosyltransferase family protein [Cohnella xylanilytica]
MNERKICFISCVNNPIQYNRAIQYMKMIEVPDGFETEFIDIRDAVSLTSGYNRAMRMTDAKYKVYLHQDVYILNRAFLKETIRLFGEHPELGALGMAGAERIPANGVWYEGAHRYGKVYGLNANGLFVVNFHEVPEGEYRSALVVDGLLIMTQYDVPWREDLFRGWHFYDVSQSLELRKAGYDVGILGQTAPWVIHDCVLDFDGYEENRLIFMEHYSEWVEGGPKANAASEPVSGSGPASRQASGSASGPGIRGKAEAGGGFEDETEGQMESAGGSGRRNGAGAEADSRASAVPLAASGVDDRKICFITCVNDPRLYDRARQYMKLLQVPEGFEVEYVPITDASSMTSGYNRAMKMTNAKYKIYLHQDVFILYPNFLLDILRLFAKHPKVGMLGMIGIGSPLPEDAVWVKAPNSYGKLYGLNYDNPGELMLIQFRDFLGEYQEARVVDGMLIATQYDLPWREDLFAGWHFYDTSQSMEFVKKGYEVGIVKQHVPWTIHACDVNEMIGYEEARRIFVREYGELLKRG